MSRLDTTKHVTRTNDMQRSFQASGKNRGIYPTGTARPPKKLLTASEQQSYFQNELKCMQWWIAESSTWVYKSDPPRLWPQLQCEIIKLHCVICKAITLFDLSWSFRSAFATGHCCKSFTTWMRQTFIEAAHLFKAGGKNSLLMHMFSNKSSKRRFMKTTSRTGRSAPGIGGLPTHSNWTACSAGQGPHLANPCLKWNLGYGRDFHEAKFEAPEPTACSGTSSDIVKYSGREAPEPPLALYNTVGRKLRKLVCHCKIQWTACSGTSSGTV